MAKWINTKKGADLLKSPLVIALFLVLMIGVGFVIANFEILGAGAIVALPVLFLYFYLIFTRPRIGFIILLIYNFLALGLTRYIPGVPFGLGVDVQLVVMYISLIVSTLYSKIHWNNAKNDLLLLALIWFGYTLLQLVNPESVSKIAWVYAMRGVSLYMLLTIPLVFIVFNEKKDLLLFFKLWAVLAVIASLKGVMQKFIGPDPWEQAWLNAGGDLTHMLFGKLRVFSFMSDAGQFGGAQGHSAVVFLILAYHEKIGKKLKYFYLIAGILSLYGMMISGTRGSLAVPIAGFALYVLLQRKFKVILVGILAVIAVFIFFRYTTIGNGNYTVLRMRSAFNLDDASFQVRLDNQKKLKTYMASKPFGGGIGSAGNWGMRFSPNTFLAQTPTDSWYVMIWAEQGIIGLLLHLFILFYIVVKSSYIIMFKLRNPDNIARMSALVSGIWGVMVASFTNGVLGQMPTGIIIYTSMAFLFMAKKLDS